MIEFKSRTEYFEAEKEGLKNNTIREIDTKDGRFLSLLEMARRGKFDMEHLKITRVELPHDFFVRQIKHVTVWGNFLIITWRS